MSMTQADVTGDLTLVAMKWPAYPTRVTELQNIATYLGPDATTHDATIETPPAGTRLGAAQTNFSNAALLVVNKAKGGNVPNAQIAAAINFGLGNAIPPSNTTAPVVSGTGTVGNVLSLSNGVWQPTPASYSRQWRRNGVNIAGATATSYTLVAADSGTSVSGAVTASNNAGSATAVSNAIAVA